MCPFLWRRPRASSKFPTAPCGSNRTCRTANGLSSTKNTESKTRRVRRRLGALPQPQVAEPATIRLAQAQVVGLEQMGLRRDKVLVAVKGKVPGADAEGKAVRATAPAIQAAGGAGPGPARGEAAASC